MCWGTSEEGKRQSHQTFLWLQPAFGVWLLPVALDLRDLRDLGLKEQRSAWNMLHATGEQRACTEEHPFHWSRELLSCCKFSPGFYRRQFCVTATTQASEHTAGLCAKGALADEWPFQLHGPFSSQEEFRIMWLGTSCRSGDRWSDIFFLNQGMHHRSHYYYFYYAP